jgi:hypothetical protein
MKSGVFDPCHLHPSSNIGNVTGLLQLHELVSVKAADLFFEVPVKAQPFRLPFLQSRESEANSEGFIKWCTGHDHILLIHERSEIPVWFLHQEEVQALLA